MLCIVAIITLPDILHASKEEDEADGKRFKILFYQDTYTREFENGREFVHPDDPNKVLKIHLYDKKSDIDETVKITSEQNALQTLMQKGEEVGVAVTQKLSKVLDFKISNRFGGISFAMDRYRGTLVDGIKNDAVLRASLADFASRLSMYRQLAFIFQQMSAANMKYCNIEVDRVLYKKAGDDFSKVPFQETDSEFDFVLTDYLFVKDLDSPCVEGFAGTWDQQDAKGNIPQTGACKGKVEIFGLAMLILKIETNLLMVKQDGSVLSKDQNMKDALKTMPDAPKYISKTFSTKQAILTTQSFEILAKVWDWVGNASADPDTLIDWEFILSGSDLLPYMAYVEQANLLIFEQRDLGKYPALGGNHDVRGKVVGNYAALNTLLQSMLQPNGDVDGRPDAASVVTALTQIQQGYVANIQSLSRILLV